MKNSSVHVITPATTYVLIDLVTSGWAPAGALNPDAMPCVTVAGRAAAQALATCPASPAQPHVPGLLPGLPPGKSSTAPALRS